MLIKSKANEEGPEPRRTDDLGRMEWPINWERELCSISAACPRRREAPAAAAPPRAREQAKIHAQKRDWATRRAGLKAVSHVRD